MIYGKRLPPNSHPCKEFRPLNRDRFVLPVLVDVREQLQSESQLIHDYSQRAAATHLGVSKGSLNKDALLKVKVWKDAAKEASDGAGRIPTR